MEAHRDGELLPDGFPIEVLAVALLLAVLVGEDENLASGKIEERILDRGDRVALADGRARLDALVVELGNGRSGDLVDAGRSLRPRPRPRSAEGSRAAPAR